MRVDRGWRECESGQGVGGTGDGGSVRGDKGDRGWRECEKGPGGGGRWQGMEGV